MVKTVGDILTNRVYQKCLVIAITYDRDTSMDLCHSAILSMLSAQILYSEKSFFSEYRRKVWTEYRRLRRYQLTEILSDIRDDLRDRR